MIKLDITRSPFMNEPTVSADQWMNDNIGELLADNPALTIGKGWKVYMEEDRLAEDHGCWYAEFENETDASWFLLRWSQ